MATDDFAIIVGINTYPKIRPLRGPELDATRFYRWLTSMDSDKGQVPDDEHDPNGSHVVKVLTSQFQTIEEEWAEPTSDRIERAFDVLRERVRKYTDENGQARRLYIYLAGHGLSRDVEGAALLGANADYETRLGFYIEGRLYAHWFEKSGYFKEIVLLMDCCRDDYPDAPERRPAWKSVQDQAGADVRVFQGYATKWSSQAREREIPEGSGEWQGLFTKTLLDGLNSADVSEVNGITGVTGATLEKYIYAQLPLLAGQKQEPRIHVESQRDFVWAVKPQPVLHTVKIVITPPEDVPVEVEDQDGKLIGTFRANKAIILENVLNGIYNLRWPQTGQEIGFDVVGADDIIAVKVSLNAEPEERVTYV